MAQINGNNSSHNSREKRYDDLVKRFEAAPSGVSGVLWKCEIWGAAGAHASCTEFESMFASRVRVHPESSCGHLYDVMSERLYKIREAVGDSVRDWALLALLSMFSDDTFNEMLSAAERRKALDADELVTDIADAAWQDQQKGPSGES